ncbi:MAG: hypothetical protein ACERIH_04685 [Labilibaculum antarcticum]
MNVKNLGILISIVLFSACASIPKETVLLSQTLGNDLQILHKSHRDIVDIHFKKIENDINSFVDEVYAPFVIHFALKAELKRYKEGVSSLYGIIEIAGKKEGKKESKDAIDVMQEFQEAARNQIESQRRELLLPIKEQHSELIRSINLSYENASHANATITAYLQSLRKLKGSQQEALSKIGLDGADTIVTKSLLKVSEQVEKAVKTGKKIDIQSEDAYKELEKISNQIKEITN